jgi:hypothetical protein
MIAYSLSMGQADRYISSDQALESVRSFIGDQEAPVSINRLYPAKPFDRYDTHYEVTVADPHPWAGDYGVRATDGIVIFMHRRRPERSSEETPSLSLEEAYNIAANFVRRHYPPFTKRRWQHEPFRYSRIGNEYHFSWQEVLNAQGVLGPYFVQVTVNGITGDVVNYYVPPERRIIGPTIPQLSYLRALQIARRYAFFDPDAVPFQEVTLQVSENAQGIQWLWWRFNQFPKPDEDPTLRFTVLVDAIRGYVNFDKPLSEIAGIKVPRIPPLPRTIGLRLPSAQGRLLQSPVPPVIQNNNLWIRVELLRGLGARVQIDPKGVEIRAGERTLSGKALGAKLRDYGWWVPLRATARALGWRVDWVSAKREAVVHAPQK